MKNQANGRRMRILLASGAVATVAIASAAAAQDVQQPVAPTLPGVVPTLVSTLIGTPSGTLTVEPTISATVEATVSATVEATISSTVAPTISSTVAPTLTSTLAPTTAATVAVVTTTALPTTAGATTAPTTAATTVTNTALPTTAGGQAATATTVPAGNATFTPTAARTRGTAATATVAARPFIGIAIEDEDDDVVIVGVVEQSPADAAGIEPGDVINAVNGTEVETSSEVVAIIGALAIGDTVTLDIERDGEVSQIAIQLRDAAEFSGELETMREEMDDVTATPEMQMIEITGPIFNLVAFENGRLGIRFVTLTEEVAAEQSMDMREGALITLVDENAPAFEAGLLEGDIITEVNGDLIDQERILRDRLVAYEPGDTVTLTIIRDGEKLEIDVTLAEQVGGDVFALPDGSGVRFPEGLLAGLLMTRERMDEMMLETPEMDMDDTATPEGEMETSAPAIEMTPTATNVG